MTDSLEAATVAWQFVSPRRFTARLVFRSGLVSPPSSVLEPIQEGSFIPSDLNLTDGLGVYTHEEVPSIAIAHGTTLVDYLCTRASESKSMYEEISARAIDVEGQGTIMLLCPPGTDQLHLAKPIIFAEGHNVTEVPTITLGDQPGG